MKLFIQIRDGMPHEHPIIEDNFLEAFLHIDPDNLPPEFARFERIAQPVVGVYEIYEGVTYEWVDDIVKDVHHVRAMTAEEKTIKQNEVKADWGESGFASWVFDEETCAFKPPVPYPDDGKPYSWDEPTTSWVEIASETV